MTKVQCYLPGYNVMTLKESNLVDISKLEIHELMNLFGDLYVLYVKIPEMELSKDNLILKRVPFRMLTTPLIKHHLTIISQNLLPTNFVDINGVNSSVNCTELLVIPLLTLTPESINAYLSKYSGISNMGTIMRQSVIGNYFHDSRKNDKENLILSQMLMSLSESNYWCTMSNCMVDESEKFKNRVFNMYVAPTTDKEKEDILRVLNSGTEYDLDTTFLNNVIDITKVKKEASLINFRMNSGKILSQENFCELFNRYLLNNNEKHLYLLITNLLLSKDLCHLVINNKYVIDKIFNIGSENQLFRKYYQLFSRLWSYAWYTMLQKETNKHTYTTEEDVYVYTIDVANKLPYFPSYSLSTSPYAPISVKKTVIAENTNILGYEKYAVPYGVCDLNMFNNRKDIFIGVRSVTDGLSGTKFAITGSILAACLPKFNPLWQDTLDEIDNFDDKKFKTFVNNYYNSSDIDVMVNSKTYINFIDDVEEFVDVISNNIIKNKSVSKSEIVITPIKKCVIFVSNNFIEKYVIPNSTYTLDDIKKNIDEMDIKKLFYKWYVYEKLQDIKKHKDTDIFIKKYEQYFYPCSIDDVKISIIHKKNMDSSVCSIKESIKYKISSKYLARPFELFKIKNNDFFGTVSRFHLPCVRAYYRNNQVYMLPSFITACMELVNINYKYFAVVKNPYEIVQKYRERGFGTILNKWEKQKFNEYITSVGKQVVCGNLILDTSEMAEINGINSVTEYINKLYSVGINIYYDNYQNKFFNYNCINGQGNIITFKKWHLEACYEEPNKLVNTDIDTDNDTYNDTYTDSDTDTNSYTNNNTNSW